MKREEAKLPCSFNLSLLYDYKNHLHQEERSTNTIAKYVRDLRAFFSFIGDTAISKDAVLAWKEHLIQTHAPTSVNSMLAAVNGFLEWTGLPLCKVKPLKIQHTIFAKPEKELTETEYRSLVAAAEREGNRRLSLLLQTICSTGIRVSELQSITVQAIQAGRAMVDCKGKSRIVFLPPELGRILKQYCKKQQIKSGLVFCTKSGKALDRSNIWKMMKELCKSAGVESGKVFPHNLRHLFARCYYQIEKDLSRLADLLGHSNISTTRIYTMESGMEHVKQLGRMRLVLSDI